MSFKYEKQFSKEQNILNFLVREEDGATMEQIAKEVFNEAPRHRQANQTAAKAFFDELDMILGDMILSGHIESEGTRFYFKYSQTDVPMESHF